MFKCQLCGQQVPRGVPCKKLVTQSRTRIYSQHWVRAPNTHRNKERYRWRDLPRKNNGGSKNRKPRLIEVLVPLHSGWEIAEELRACPGCSAEHRPPIPATAA